VPIDVKALGRWNVSHVLTRFPVDAPDLRLYKQVGGVYIYANEASQFARVESEGANQYTAANTGALTIGVTLSALSLVAAVVMLVIRREAKNH
jgi:hypothetical protein